MTQPMHKHKADEIDPQEVLKLAAMQCTMEEMSHFFDCSVDTLERNFADIIKNGRSKGKISVKRALFDKANKGDLGAIVWWSKNFMGMSDKVEHKTQQLTVSMTSAEAAKVIQADAFAPPSLKEMPSERLIEAAEKNATEKESK